MLRAFFFASFPELLLAESPLLQAPGPKCPNILARLFPNVAILRNKGVSGRQDTRAKINTARRGDVRGDRTGHER